MAGHTLGIDPKSRIPSSIEEARAVIAHAVFGGVSSTDLRLAQAFVAGRVGEPLRHPCSTGERVAYLRGKGEK